MNTLRLTWSATKAKAKIRPRSPNALGIDMVMTMPTTIIKNSMMRTGARSGSSQLVTQAVKIQAHQTAISSRPVSTTPANVGWAIRPCDSWVTANTNTRSKNNST